MSVKLFACEQGGGDSGTRTGLAKSGVPSSLAIAAAKQPDVRSCVGWNIGTNFLTVETAAASGMVESLARK